MTLCTVLHSIMSITGSTNHYFIKFKIHNMKYNFSKLQSLFFTTLILASLVACNSGGSAGNTDSTGTESTDGSGDANAMLGAGSTFIYPLFSKLFSVYNEQTG